MTIPYNRVPGVTPFFLDYLYHFERVAEYFTAPPFTLASYQSLALKLRGQSKDRQALAEILVRQNKKFGSSPSVFENISRLKDKQTFAVVTGQQIGLFSGPAFTLYKALTAVRLAAWLSENGLASVPVFWLATEDHDHEEVAQTAVLDEEYSFVSLSDPGERPAPHSPAGAVKLTASVAETLDRLESALGSAGSRGNVMGDLREVYRPGTTWSLAFGRFMARLFSRWGVVLVDSYDRELHGLSSGAYAKALDEPENARRLLLDRSAKLISKGYHAQVHVTGDSTLLLQIRNGDRLVLHHASGMFRHHPDERISPADLKRDLQQDPLSLSGNVLMRSVIQDCLLPTLAYVAGPSELAYLGQAQAIYETFGRPMPVVFPRAGFTLADARTLRLLEKYRISVEDVWRGADALGRKIAVAGFSEGWTDRFDKTEHEFTRLLTGLAKDIETLDPTPP